jgi:cobalt-zinc-cadmium efflux system membrane fusion protein
MKTIIYKPQLLFTPIIILLIGCKQKQAEETAKKFTFSDTMLSHISLDTVTMKNVNGELKFSGKITPEENKITAVFPVVTGHVTKLNVSFGDYVQKGQVLAIIRSTEIADFEKQRRDAETNLVLAKKNLKTEQELYESKLNTERDIAAAQKEVESAQAELKRIEEVFKIYHTNNGSYYNVIAPISGFIIDKKINVDMQLPAGFSESIFTIAQIDEVFVSANVYETDISKLSLGMPAEIEILSYPGKLFSGKIDKILNILDPETKTLKIRVRLPNPGFALKPEMAATIHIRHIEQIQRPSIPAEAVVFAQSKYFAMVFHEKDSIETRVIQPLKTTGGTTFIEAGLQPGEKVIHKNALLVYNAIND